MDSVAETRVTPAATSFCFESYVGRPGPRRFSTTLTTLLADEPRLWRQGSIPYSEVRILTCKTRGFPGCALGRGQELRNGSVHA